MTVRAYRVAVQANPPADVRVYSVKMLEAAGVAPVFLSAATIAREPGVVVQFTPELAAGSPVPDQMVWRHEGEPIGWAVEGFTAKFVVPSVPPPASKEVTLFYQGRNGTAWGPEQSMTTVILPQTEWSRGRDGAWVGATGPNPLTNKDIPSTYPEPDPDPDPQPVTARVLFVRPATATVSSNTHRDAISAQAGFTVTERSETAVTDADVTVSDVVVLAAGVGGGALTAAPSIKTTTKPVLYFGTASAVGGTAGLSLVNATSGAYQTTTASSVYVPAAMSGQSVVGGLTEGTYDLYPAPIEMRDFSGSLLGTGADRVLMRHSTSSFVSGVLYLPGELLADGAPAPGLRFQGSWSALDTAGWTAHAKTLAVAPVVYAAGRGSTTVTPPPPPPPDPVEPGDPTHVMALRQGLPSGASIFNPTTNFNLFRVDSVAESGLHPQSATMVASLVNQIATRNAGSMNINTVQYNAHTWIVGPNTPKINVVFKSKNGTDLKRPMWDTYFSQVPWPWNAVPSLGRDRAIILYEPATRTLWELWRVRVKPGRPGSEDNVRYKSDGTVEWSIPYDEALGGEIQASFGGRILDAALNPGHYPNVNSLTYGVAATSIAYPGTAITIADVNAAAAGQGHFGHAIALQLPEHAKWSVFSWPALRSDGNGIGPIPEGLRFRLNPSVDVAALPGLNNLERWTLRTIQRYGMIVTDNAGVPSLVGESGGVGVQDDGSYKNLWSGIFATHGGGLRSYDVFKHIDWSLCQAMPFDWGKPA